MARRSRRPKQFRGDVDHNRVWSSLEVGCDLEISWSALTGYTITSTRLASKRPDLCGYPLYGTVARVAGIEQEDLGIRGMTKTLHL